MVGTPELAARRAHEPQRRVVPLREAEPDADFGDAALHAGRAELHRDAQRLEHVGRPALRRRGAVAVLHDARAGARGDQRGDGRHVDRAGAIAAGAARVDRAVGHVDRRREAQHRAHHRGELGDRFALRAQRDREPGGLDIGCASREDLAERGLDLFGLDVGSPHELREHGRDDLVHSRILTRPPQSHHRS